MSRELCRLCLSECYLAPIFENLEQSENYSSVLALTTGLDIKLNDGLPQKICNQCTELVSFALKLRNQSHSSEMKLLEQGYKKTEEKVKKILTDKKNSREKKHEENHNDNIDQKTNTRDHFDEHHTDFEIEVQFDRITDLQDEEAGTTFFKNDKKATENDVLPKCSTNKNIASTSKISRKERRQQYLSLVDGDFDPKGPVICKVCKKVLSKWTTFISHAKLHLGFKFVCEFCGKSFISSTQLNRHCRSHHGMQRALACRHCDYLALDTAQLVLHERRVHTGERPYICDVCAAAYHSRRCLIQHIETHETDAKVKMEVISGASTPKRIKTYPLG